MAQVFKQLFIDFFSTIVFLAVYAVTGDILIATGVAIAGAIAQFVLARLRRQTLDVMTWASLALVIVLGGATLLTHDPRFVLIKPSIVHFAIGAIMLRRDWMLRYSPPLVREHIPHLARQAGYAWAILMFALGFGTIAVAMTGDIRLWAIYVSVVAVGAKVLAFAIQYVVFRIVITRKIRAAAQPAFRPASNR
jgi:intracellular septation protein A